MAITSGRLSPLTSSTKVRKKFEYSFIVNDGGFAMMVPPSAKPGPAYQYGPATRSITPSPLMSPTSAPSA